MIIEAPRSRDSRDEQKSTFLTAEELSRSPILVQLAQLTKGILKYNPQLQAVGYRHAEIPRQLPTSSDVFDVAPEVDPNNPYRYTTITTIFEDRSPDREIAHDKAILSVLIPPIQALPHELDSRRYRRDTEGLLIDTHNLEPHIHRLLLLTDYDVEPAYPIDVDAGLSMAVKRVVTAQGAHVVISTRLVRGSYNLKRIQAHQQLKDALMGHQLFICQTVEQIPTEVRNYFEGQIRTMGQGRPLSDFFRMFKGVYGKDLVQCNEVRDRLDRIERSGRQQLLPTD